MQETTQHKKRLRKRVIAHRVLEALASGGMRERKRIELPEDSIDMPKDSTIGTPSTRLVAFYDQTSDAAVIDLTDDSQQDRGYEIATGIIVGLRNNQIVQIEILGVEEGADIQTGLQLVAQRYSLNSDELMSALCAAVAVAGRQVTISFVGEDQTATK